MASPRRGRASLISSDQLVDFSVGPKPRIVLFVGVNGSGKTTTIGKIASKLSAQGADIVLAAGDTFRAAAVEQLKVWAERANARLFPVEGGLVGTAKMDTDILTSRIVTTSGFAACADVLRGIRAGELSACLVELMACEGGCIGGPACLSHNARNTAQVNAYGRSSAESSISDAIKAFRDEEKK